MTGPTAWTIGDLRIDELQHGEDRAVFRLLRLGATVSAVGPTWHNVYRQATRVDRETCRECGRQGRVYGVAWQWLCLACAVDEVERDWAYRGLLFHETWDSLARGSGRP